ncbi:hypothetical protein [Polaromonas sp. YR568]|uniref:hypothetical protein n=1 Tax=Polaromonas sp. YR568 TaxID=1855301 RepID=UPI0031379B5D
MVRIEKQQPHGRKLAVVGGGGSTALHIEALRSWDGEIWAINGTAAWLSRNGIRATLFTIDPGDVRLFDTSGVDSALLATCCHPELREKFKTYRVFDLVETHPGGVMGGTTSASRAATLALSMGYYSIHFFGCDSSFEVGNDHVDRDEGIQEMAIVRAGGRDYTTYLEYLLQAECLSKLLMLAPSVFKSHSGGLLDAITANPDTWEVVAVSAQLKKSLEQINGANGLYEGAYVAQTQETHDNCK